MLLAWKQVRLPQVSEVNPEAVETSRELGRLLEIEPDTLSVSRVLEVAGVLPKYPPGPYKDRGIAIDKALALDEDGDLDEESCPDLMGYVRAWRAARAESGLVVLAREVAFVNAEHGYHGRYDRRMGVTPTSDISALWDIKHGKPSPWHRLQLAAYTQGNLGVRGVCYLAGDGSYKFKDHTATAKADWDGWLGCLGLAKWKIR